MEAIHQASRRWDAHWIWDKDESGRNSFKLFRKEFVWTQAGDGIQEVKLHITADTRYQLYLDEVMIGQGPPLCVNYFHYYDTYDLTFYLKPGTRHCLAVIVNHQGTTPGGRAGFLAELEDSSGKVMCRTDASWSVSEGEAWQSETYQFRMSYYASFQEFYDARKQPQGWMRAGYDDSKWRRARVLRGQRSDLPPAVIPWTLLIPRDIPHMVETKRYADRIDRLEEVQDLLNRMRAEDLSINLSMCGQPLCHSTIIGAEALLAGSCETIVQNSLGHMDGTIDGIYNPCILLDFGRSMNAYPEITLFGVDGGIVDIGYAERLISGQFNNAIEGQFADRYIMKAGEQTFRPMTWKSFRYMKLMFRSCFEPVKIAAVKAVETKYPFEAKGSFYSQDETLNRIFDICRHTIELCSNESIMDTPWREQAQFTGDVAGVTLGGIYSCFGETRLPGKFLRQSAANQLPTGMLTNVTNSLAGASNADWKTVHPDYSLWWIFGLWQHYEYTGNERWIHEYYPHALKIIQAYSNYIGPSKLLENVPYAIIIDWADLDRRGINAPLNAMFYGISGLVEQMAILKKDSYTESWISGIRKDLRLAYDPCLYDAGRHCYADANVNGSFSEKISEHGNMAAVYWGLCLSNERAIQVIQQWLDDNKSYTECQPFFSSVTLRALTRYGFDHEAINLIRERWGKRMVDRGASSTYEEWNLNGSWRNGDHFAPIMRTQSHAWSAFPAEFLIRELAGFRILQPGCAKVELHPVLLDFNAEVDIPTPLGIIQVAWKDGSVQVAAPQEVEIIRI